MTRTRTTPAPPDAASPLNRLPVRVSSGLYVDEADPAANKSAFDPQVKFEFASDVLQANQRWAIYQFPAVLTSVRAIWVPTRTVGWALDGDGDFAAGRDIAFTWRYELITAAFDPLTVTWNTKPASVAFATDFSLVCSQVSELGVQMAGSAPNSVAASADATGTFYGFYIRPVSLTNPQLNSGGRNLTGTFNNPTGALRPVILRTLA